MRREPIDSQITLRLPKNLKAYLQAEAVRNFSSQNSEIIRAIRERMERSSQAAPVNDTLRTHQADAA